MTMDLYEQKYKEALERAKHVHTTNVDENKKSTEYIFPELKDSEEEKIRKAIICGMNALKNNQKKKTFADIPLDDCIAWLEKQGNQKPADKVEPEFHEGDWVVNKLGDSWHIDSFDKENYQVSNGKGNYNWFPISKQDEMHLWTIEDAKDGDVLSGETDGEVFIFLFNQIQDKWIVAHGYYSETDSDFIEKAYLHRRHENLFSPATKEQRNLLFIKMKEAGYEWDNEKKELRKIEFKTFNEWLDEYNKRRKNAK